MSFYTVPREVIEDVASSMPLPGLLDAIGEKADMGAGAAVLALSLLFYARRYDREALA